MDVRRLVRIRIAKGLTQAALPSGWVSAQPDLSRPLRFVQWYNHEHLHSGIRYVTPAQRHAGQDGRVLASLPRGPTRSGVMDQGDGLGQVETDRWLAAWFAAMPTTPEVVGAYLAAADERYAMPTWRRRVAPIARA